MILRAAPLALFATLALSTGSALAAVRIAIDPASAPADSVARIRVSGLTPRARIAVRASAVDADGATWRSSAEFDADKDGVVDVARRAPVAGSYAGVDPMGLFWSLRREGAPGPRGGRAPVADVFLPPDAPVFAHAPKGAVEVHIEAVSDGIVVAEALTTREWTSPDVAVTEVSERGLVGRLYEPPGVRHPAILVLSGSNGGIQATHAPILSSHGYVTFSLAYFRAPGLPKDLVEVPLEYFRAALDWLRARPSVDPDRIAVLGISRGAELALLLAATYPDVRAVVALAPSNVVWEGAVRDPEKKGVAALKIDRTSWTLGGRPLDFVPKTVDAGLAARVEAGERFAGIEMMNIDAADAASRERAAIPLEKIHGAVFLVSGTADRMWPSAAMANAGAARLRGAKFRHRVENLVYEGAGHVFSDSWMPASFGGTIGGAPEANARAFRDYWPRLLSFLRESLGPAKGRR